jgi:hypothetical protein
MDLELDCGELIALLIKKNYIFKTLCKPDHKYSGGLK